MSTVNKRSALWLGVGDAITSGASAASDGALASGVGHVDGVGAPR